MKVLTCIVVGAGYAGIHVVKEIRKTFKDKVSKHPLRLILVDQNSYHLRKVLLFKPAVTNENIKIPLTKMFPDGVEIVRAIVTKIEAREKKLLYQDAMGNENAMNYDILVMAAGSVVRQPDREQGGMPLATLDSALKIRGVWLANMKQAVTATSAKERERLMTVAIAGAGISGIETAAELAHYIRKDAEQLGLDPEAVKINLYNTNKRLFQDSPAKVGMKLERILQDCGIKVIHGSRVFREMEGKLTLASGETLPVGLCVWTLGLLPNPLMRNIGMPVTDEGYVITDSSYRVQDAQGVYSIGDCARIVDPHSGRADGMTCKEAIAQAARLSKILLADLEGKSAPFHTSYMDFFCIGLGPEKGLTWVRKWGIDFVITGKLGWRIKKYTWDFASFIK
ncbi:NAD(P)/FAD-dependent oxidoreductase [Sporosarcina beigongshangi]|uniref:NAD(P)/FAD-dependent oxidoreductase n=1 Tax=Sporosarcina beigongshangi TaxID=2782538 RepID=UPI00193A948B|nr:FAD-dependent oxidoreductase [Sporosarcina beigongshangi]